MTAPDSLQAFEHDHADLNRRVLELGKLLAPVDGNGAATQAPGIAGHLLALRDDLFIHFAREEEGLFPFLVRTSPDLEPSIAELTAVHDELCGVLARMVHVVGGPHAATLVPLFERFEAAYARHAGNERAFLELASTRLTPGDRLELAAWIRGL